MKRLKTFAKYVLIITLFYIFSNILIFWGINTNYDNLSIKGTIPEQVIVKTASATLVNGEVKGYLLDTHNISDKYIKFSFYTDTDSLACIKCLKISELKDNEFSFYFKFNYVDSYSVELVDEAQDTAQFDKYFSFEQYRKYKIMYWFALLMFI
ncbi:MAG: hypothetical protein HFJ48_07450 [Clostridia bacterium]|nr:hypothetical protein [Clostridia bacterium]